MSLKLKYNKKGSSVDNFFVIIMFFGLILFFVTFHIFWNVVSTEVTELWTGSSKGAEIQANMERASSQFDWICVLVYVALHLGILVTAYLLRTHPVVFVAAIILCAILALVAAPLSDAYGDMKADSDAFLTAAIDEMPMSNFIMDNLPKFEIIFGFITIIIMFAFASTGGDF